VTKLEKCQAPYPNVVNTLKDRLIKLRKTGAPLTVVTARGIMLATIIQMNPEILEITFKDGSNFRASDSFVRGWLHKALDWSFRKATRAAHKMPENWEDLCEKSFLRKAYNIKEHDIPAELYVNSDQTQVMYAPGDKMTWADAGAKQVSLTNTDEKRAFTVMVSVASDGTLLPFQAIYQGKTSRSCPAPSSPHYQDALSAGFHLVCSGTDTYWSNQQTMKLFVNKILAPYYDKKKTDLGFPPSQKSLWQIDVWSVHRSEEFRKWMKDNHPTIIIDFVPGGHGCTGVHQPCDVGIQRPFKSSTKRSYHEDVVQEMLVQLDKNSGNLMIDNRILVLRNRSVGWLWNAFQAVNKKELVQKVS
jgi:hypothetical protein